MGARSNQDDPSVGGSFGNELQIMLNPVPLLSSLRFHPTGTSHVVNAIVRPTRARALGVPCLMLRTTGRLATAAGLGFPPSRWLRMAGLARPGLLPPV
jgi:hypothetical protein